MEVIIGTCPECESFIWAQADGEPPILVKNSCSCWNNRVVVSKVSNMEALGKIDTSTIKLIYKEEHYDTG